MSSLSFFNPYIIKSSSSSPGLGHGGSFADKWFFYGPLLIMCRDTGKNHLPFRHGNFQINADHILRDELVKSGPDVPKFY